MTDTFRPELKQYSPIRTTALPSATGDSRIVLSTARQLHRGMVKEGYGYKKAGVALLELARPAELQRDLFTPATSGNSALMATLDKINQKFGPGTACLGATRWADKPQWGVRQQRLSACYTTSSRDTPRARC